MHDDAPTQLSHPVRDVSNAQYDRWIDVEGPTAWPPRSSDLNPLNFTYGET
jgi:hypothetical protein